MLTGILTPQLHNKNERPGMHIYRLHGYRQRGYPQARQAVRLEPHAHMSTLSGSCCNLVAKHS